jgi:hypothetical protein
MADEPIRDLSGRLGLDTTDFKTAIGAANRELRVLQSSFQAGVAALGDWASTAEGVELRAKSLTTQMEIQRLKVAALKAEHERLVLETGAHSRASQDLQIKLNKEATALGLMERELGQTESALQKFREQENKTVDVTEDLSKAQTEAAKSTNKFGSAVKTAAGVMAIGATGIAGLGAATLGFARNLAGAVAGVLQEVGQIGAQIATTLAAISAAAAIVVVGFLGSTIGPASDLAETANKITVVFGEGAAAINEFAGNAATALGQSRQQALDAAATFGIFGKSAGLSGKVLVDFTTDLVKASSDFASFYNSTPKEAIDAISAALRGETEGVRKFGIMLDDASLRQKAFQLGITKTTTDALTPQQKVLAAYSLILEQGAAANDDFYKTSAGLANQQRILAALWENLKSQLGTGLLPAAQAVFQTFTRFLSSQAVTDGVANLSKGLSDLATTFVGVVSGDGMAALAGATSLISGLGQAFGFTKEQADTAGVRVGNVLNGIVEIFKTGFDPKKGLLQNVGDFIMQVGKLDPVLAPLSGLLADVVGYVQQFSAVIAGAGGDAGKLGAGLGGLLGDILKNLLTGKAQLLQIGVSLISGLAEAIIAAIPELLPVVRQVLTAITEFFTTTLPKLAPVAVEIIGALVDFLADNLPMIADASLGIIMTLITGIVPLLPQLVQTAADIITTLLTGLAEALPTLIPVIAETIPLIVKVLVNNLPLIIDAALQLIIALAQGLVAALPILIEAIPSIVDAIIDALAVMAPEILSAGVDLVGVLIKGIFDALPTLGEAIVTLVTEIITSLAENGPQFIASGQEIVNKIWNGIVGSGDWLKTDVLGFFQGIIDSAIAGITGGGGRGSTTIDVGGGSVSRRGPAQIDRETLNSAVNAVTATNSTPARNPAGIIPTQSSPSIVINATVASDVDMYTLANRVAEEMRRAR